MFVGIFKFNNLTLALALPFIAATFWLPFFFSENDIVFSGIAMPFYAAVQYLFSEHKIISGSISILLIASEALLLNSFIQQFHLLKNQTFLPALLYTVLMCSFPENLFLHPVLFGNLFLILALKRCLDLSANVNSGTAAFDSAFLLSIGSLFYFPILVFFVFILAAHLSFRSFSIRDWLIAVVGIFLPYLFVYSYYFWFDGLLSWQEKITHPIFNAASNEIHYLKSFYSLLIFLIIIVVIALPPFFREMGKNKASIRSGLRLFLWLFVLSVISFFPALPDSFFHFSLAAVPLCVLFANLFLNTSRVFSEFVFSFLIFFIIIYRLNY